LCLLPKILFLAGPYANGALVSPMLLLGQQVEWVARGIHSAGSAAEACFDAMPKAEEQWMQRMHDVGEGSLLHLANR